MAEDKKEVFISNKKYINFFFGSCMPSLYVVFNTWQFRQFLTIPSLMLQ
jgi:hypothetical protein